MTHYRILILAIILGILITSRAQANICLPANSPNTQTITAIKIADKSVNEAIGVQFILPKSDKLQIETVPIGCAFAIGTVIQVPQRTVIELTSPNGNRITLIPGSRLRILKVSNKGESASIEEGRGLFNVKRALDFYEINYQSFIAAVRGTIFSVEVKPGSKITFSVEEGKVQTEREVKVQIEEGNKVASMKATETLQPGKKQSTTYLLDVDGYLKTFKTYRDAEEYFRMQLEADRKSGDQQQLADGLNKMGIILITLSKYHDAISYFNESLQITLKLFPDALHNDIASSYNNLGAAYIYLGGTENIKKAIGYYEKALQIRLKLFTDALHNGIAKSYNNLGVAYSNLGGTENLKKAIWYYEKDLQITLKLFPDGRHNDIASSYNNLGVAYSEIGGTENIKKAIEYYEKNLQINLKLFPDGLHNDVAKSYNNLGVAYSDIGGTENIRKAIEFYEKDLQITLELFPDGRHDDIAKIYNNLGRAYYYLGGTDNIKKAIEYYKKDLQIILMLFPDGLHNDIAKNYNNLGFVYRMLGGTENFKKAVDYYEQGLQIELKLFPDGLHNDIAKS